jgi:putative hydrolase of the HAD superfamily
MNVVFDFGRVLYRWRPEVVVRQALRQRVPEGADGDTAAAHWVAQVFQAYGGDWGEFDRGTVDVPELVARIAHRTGLETAEVQAVVDAAAEELQPVPDTVALVDHLHGAGHRLFYLSNMPAPFAARFEQRDAVMQRFEAGVFSSRVHLLKPEPAIFAAAERRFGVAGSSLVFLDDHLPNVLAARTAGWQALHFMDAARAGEELVTLAQGADRTNSTNRTNRTNSTNSAESAWRAAG